MGNRANPYGYSDPALGQAVSNLAQALFGSAHDDAYIANAQANRALAAKRQQEIDAAKAYQTAMQTTSSNPVFQGRIYEALGLGPVQVDASGNFIRPVGPNDPQMSVPVLPNQAEMTADQHSALARTFLGEGGNTQQTMAGLNNLGEAINHRTGERYLLNPDAPGVTENMLRGAATMLKGPGGVDENFAPTVASQNRVQNFITQRSNYGDDQRRAGVEYTANKTLEGTTDANTKRLQGTQYTADKKADADITVGRNRDASNLEGTKYTANRNYDGRVYEVNNKPVAVNQNQTLLIPTDAQQRFGGKSEVRGQQSPFIVPEGGTAIIPDDRKSDFDGGTRINGQPKPHNQRNGSGSGSGKTTKITGADVKAMDGQINGYEKTLNATHDASTGIPPAIKVLIREAASTKMRSGTKDEVNNIPLATSNALKEFYGNPHVYNPTLGRKVIVPERVILDAQSAIKAGADRKRVLNVANSKFGVSQDALDDALTYRSKGR